MNCIHKAGRLVGWWRGQPVGRRTRGHRMWLVACEGRKSWRCWDEQLKLLRLLVRCLKTWRWIHKTAKQKVLFGMGVKLGISHYWKKRDEDEIAVLLDAATFCMTSLCHVSTVIFSHEQDRRWCRPEDIPKRRYTATGLHGVTSQWRWGFNFNCFPRLRNFTFILRRYYPQIGSG